MIDVKGEYVAVIVVLDGCSVPCLKKAHTPVLDGIREKGTATFKCKSVYPTVTYSAHCSIITGKFPATHGIVGNCFYDRKSDKIIDFDFYDVNSFITENTIYEMVDGITAAVGEPITRGADIVISKSEIQERDVWEQDRYATEKAIEVLKTYSPRLIIINFPGVDAILERYGPDSRQAVKILEDADKLIGQLESFLNERYSDHLLVVIADHGMTSVHSNVDLSKVLEKTGAKVCPSHRFAHVYVDMRDISRVKQLLMSDDRLELVLSHEELDRIRLSNPRAGDLVVVARGGYEFSKQKLRGSHGGITSDEMNVPLLINKIEYNDLVRDADITVIPKIVLRYLTEKDAEGIAKSKLLNTDPSHDWSHTERVLSLSTQLAIKYGADVEVVRLACILHDAERGYLQENHSQRGAELAERFLQKRRYPISKIKKVKEAILLHHTKMPEKLKTLEAMILWDADKLDALGLTGLARCLLEAGYFGKGIDEALAHLERDINEFKDAMHFKETKRIAKQKIKNVSKVIESLRKELSHCLAQRRYKSFILKAIIRNL